MKKTLYPLIIILALIMTHYDLQASQLTDVSILDQDYIRVYYRDGDVEFRDDGKGKNAFTNHGDTPDGNKAVWFGKPLNVQKAAAVSNWVISSEEDPAYGTDGKSPVSVHRKSKITAMAQMGWDNKARDFRYDTPFEHVIFLRLPSPLQEGKTYRLKVQPELDSSAPVKKLTFNIFENVSEAIHINLVGFIPLSKKPVDLYQWMGDGGFRNYKTFEGKKTFIYNIGTKEKILQGEVRFYKKNGKDIFKHNLIQSDVWTADFLYPHPGTYRIAIEGVGCSRDFEIRDDIYRTPFDVSVKGFYYMRIGEEKRDDIKPVPRQPRFIPDKDPANCKVYITTMHPYHPDWKTFSGGDKWDNPKAWFRYRKDGNPENPGAWGGHSDALDWDRHLGHVSIIYDMLFPYILTDGALSDDDAGIAESGNSIPDIIDEAQNEVDFWLRLRDGDGYSHGLTNPTHDKKHILFQAGCTPIAAWANACSCAMLAQAYRIAGNTEQKNYYQNEAETAYRIAEQSPDQFLDKSHGAGNVSMTGADLKMTAAAYLYNLTGDTKYEDTVNKLSTAKDKTSDPGDQKRFQVWGMAAYLLTKQKVNYPDLQEMMTQSIMSKAKEMEAGLTESRPSRRASSDKSCWFPTVQDVHRTILAHRVAEDRNDKQFFLNALVLEADWGLGRNPLNMIQMTTASTPLEKHRSVENAYTTGQNDGTPGVHPGHTPYLNIKDWGGLIMGRPQWMTSKNYPNVKQWPLAECYYNTRYVYAHSEFTPQQTMGCKTALYGYLYGIGK